MVKIVSYFLAPSRSAYVNVPKLLNLLCSEIESWLVLSPASVHNHTMQAAGFLHNIVDSFRNTGLVDYISLDGVQLPWESLRHSGIIIARITNVDRIDSFGII